MQKIITDKKPFVTERTERVTLNEEAYPSYTGTVDEALTKLAREKQIPEGLQPKRMIQQNGLFQQMTWEFHWFEVLL